MPPIAFQLYSARNFGPVGEVLTTLAALGYPRVEGFGGLFETDAAVEALAHDLARTGLSMPTAHIGWEDVRDAPNRVIALAKRLGVEVVVLPYLAAPPQTPEAWQRFAAEVAHAAAPLRAAGLQVAWHNHAFEFVDLGGVCPLELLLEGDPDLALELDLGWVHVAGQDPVTWIARTAQRLCAVHLKDAAPAGAAEDEDGWADLGHGVLDWAAILPALGKAGVDHLVVEHDNPSDATRFARRSLEAARAMAWSA